MTLATARMWAALLVLAATMRGAASTASTTPPCTNIINGGLTFSGYCQPDCSVPWTLNTVSTLTITVYGCNNTVGSASATVTSAYIRGGSNVVTVNGTNITGSFNQLIGTSGGKSTVVGSYNVIVNATGEYITGSDNVIDTATSGGDVITGSWNTLLPYSAGDIITGWYNYLFAGSTGNKITGNSNTLNGGASANTVFGDGNSFLGTTSEQGGGGTNNFVNGSYNVLQSSDTHDSILGSNNSLGNNIAGYSLVGSGKTITINTILALQTPPPPPPSPPPAQAAATVVSTAFSQPMGVAVDPAGNVYVADNANQRVAVVTGATTGSPVVTTLLGGATASFQGVMNLKPGFKPVGVAWNAGMTPATSGLMVTNANGGGSSSAAAAVLSYGGVVVSPGAKPTIATGPVTMMGQAMAALKGWVPGSMWMSNSMSSPWGAVVDTRANAVYSMSGAGAFKTVAMPTQTKTGKAATPTSLPKGSPILKATISSVVADAAGNTYIADSNTNGAGIFNLNTMKSLPAAGLDTSKGVLALAMGAGSFDGTLVVATPGCVTMVCAGAGATPYATAGSAFCGAPLGNKIGGLAISANGQTVFATVPGRSLVAVTGLSCTAPAPPPPPPPSPSPPPATCTKSGKTVKVNNDDDGWWKGRDGVTLGCSVNNVDHSTFDHDSCGDSIAAAAGASAGSCTVQVHDLPVSSTFTFGTTSLKDGWAELLRALLQSWLPKQASPSPCGTTFAFSSRPVWGNRRALLQSGTAVSLSITGVGNNTADAAAIAAALADINNLAAMAAAMQADGATASAPQISAMLSAFVATAAADAAAAAAALTQPSIAGSFSSHGVKGTVVVTQAPAVSSASPLDVIGGAIVSKFVIAMGCLIVAALVAIVVIIRVNRRKLRRALAAAGIVSKPEQRRFSDIKMNVGEFDPSAASSSAPSPRPANIRSAVAMRSASLRGANVQAQWAASATPTGDANKTPTFSKTPKTPPSTLMADQA